MTAANLGLFGGNFSTLLTLKACAYAILAGFTGERIAVAGNLVCNAVEEAKRINPELFQVKRIRTGLLGDGSEYWTLMGDFEIAQVLFPDDDIALALKHKIPLIPAYAAVVCVSSIPTQDWIDSALEYLVSNLQFKNRFLTQWADHIKVELDELKPLAETGRKFAGGRKPKADGPLAKAIKSYLRKNKDRRVSTAEVWSALKTKPPTGMKFVESVRLGNYIEYDKKTHKGEIPSTGYSAFTNAVSKARKAA